MAQERPFFPLLDSELILHLSRSLACTPENTLYRASDDEVDDQVKDDFVFDIDPRFLVDCDKLIVGELVGEGPYSSIYKGWYKFHPVSIKVMLPRRTLDATSECKAKFQREVNLISRIKHKNIVKFIGASIEPSMMIVTELLEGGSLQKHLESIYPGTLPLEQSISFALDISQVMEYLHENGIIHRDLRPGNLLLVEDKMHIKLADFGIAREETCGDQMTCEAGTYRYMAPEVFSREPLPKGAKKFYDHKVDVYSFAMVLWALIKNQIPFKGRNELMAAYATAQNLRPSVEEFPADILPLLQSCWAEDPKLRPEFTEITQTLTKLLHNCHLSGTEHATKNETEDHHRTTKEEECPIPRSQSVKDNYKKKHETQNQNECTEGQSHSIGVQTLRPDSGESKPKKIQNKRKRFLPCLFRCFGFPDMHASSMVVGQ